MLELKNIVKKYATGDTEVVALDGVSLKFRENEFVSILGASGCGKTTMLNIIGGLDRYTSGDLIINGRSTKEFRDSDWDSYRNHSIGFVFQSYNLIPHQTVLSNVELALTLSGVSRTERRQRAIEALNKVGLGDQLQKKPNQMSGGQMQRVAIARALVNNPDILLADEPTGALDTQTSLQIMDLLKEVAEDRLVIMVTHNPELAEQYSTRIVRLKDGHVIDDSKPIGDDEEIVPVRKAAEPKQTAKAKRKEKKKTSMSFLTALSLSRNNLMTKKGRTILTSFAGSIGIIGIALILALSNGIQGYIDQVQEDTLSTYPLTIARETHDYSAMLSAMTQVKETEDYSDTNQIHVDDSMGTMMAAMSARVVNNMEDFKVYLEAHRDELADSLSDIQYTYDFDFQIYSHDGKTQVSPSTIFENMGGSFAALGEMMKASPMMGGFNVLSEMIDNQALLDQQYDVIAGTWPQNYDEVVLVVDKNNQVSKMTLYMLGILDQGELEEIMTKLMTTGEYDATPIEPYSFDFFLGQRFKMVHATDYYEKTDKTYRVGDTTYPVWQDMRDSNSFDMDKFLAEKATELKVVGIIRPSAGAVASSISGAVGYTKALTDHYLESNLTNELILQQKATPEINVLSGLRFEKTVWTRENIHELLELIDPSMLNYLCQMLNEKIQAELPPMAQDLFVPITVETLPTVISQMDDAQFGEMVSSLEMMVQQSKDDTYEKNLKAFGDASFASPASINFYAKDFASKDNIENFIKTYNDSVQEKDQIQYTDLVGVMMSSISIIINVISYVLIAFVSISLVVSSIMIGIITYISVLERTKEIGILRAIGASKRDISRVFNAETLIVGFTAGMIGILMTVLLTLPINVVIRILSGISGVRASLPIVAAVVLVLISMFLTFIAGLIPSGVASKKDPVEALRSE